MVDYESRLQNLVYTLEVGVGAKILKVFLYCLFMVLVSMLFMARRYQGFTSPRAMEQAHLAVQIAETGSMQTKVIRPTVLRQLRENRTFRSDGSDVSLSSQPDVLYAPGYPTVLGTVFKLTGTDFESPEGLRFNPERWIIIPLNLLMVFLSGSVLYMLGRRLFSPRVAVTSVTVFFLSGLPFARAVEGTELSLALLLFTVSVWATLSVSDVWSRKDSKPLVKWGSLLILSVSCLFLIFTRYAMVSLLPGVVLILMLALKRRAVVPLIVMLLVVGAGLTPWVLRNLEVSGKPFGLGPGLALSTINPMVLERQLTPPEPIESREVFRSKSRQMIRAGYESFTFDRQAMGSGITFCLFVATFFYAFQRKQVSYIRWGVLLSYFGCTLGAGLFGLEILDLAFVLYPLVILLGTAFFYLLLDRLDIPVKVLSLSVVAVYILFQTLPLLTWMTEAKPYSYPPYNARAVYNFTEPFDDSELYVTDIPWATAWYGNQTSLYLPETVDDFLFIHDRIQQVKALYFTMESRNLPYESGLRQGAYREWLPIMERRGLPGGFPLPTYLPLGGEQILYVDHPSRFYSERSP